MVFCFYKHHTRESMKISINKEELQYYIAKQLEYRFPDRKSCLDFKESINRRAFDEALDRLEFCFKHIKVTGYSVEDGGIKHSYFNHLHSDQYSQFLYFFSNSLWKMNGNPDICSKLILLNKELNGCWYSYKGNLPDIFLLMHPVGSVLGYKNVKYSDYLVILQNVTINATWELLELGEHLFLGAGCKIIGDGKIGNRVSIGANALIKNPNIPDDYIAYQDIKTGLITQKPNKKEMCFTKEYYFNN